MRESVLYQAPRYMEDLRHERGNQHCGLGERYAEFSREVNFQDLFSASGEIDVQRPDHRAVLQFYLCLKRDEACKILDDVYERFIKVQPVPPELHALALPGGVASHVRLIREKAGPDPVDIAALRTMVEKYLAAVKKFIPNHAMRAVLIQMHERPAEVCKQEDFTVFEFQTELQNLLNELDEAVNQQLKPPIKPFRFLAISIYCALLRKSTKPADAEKEAIHQACEFAVYSESSKLQASRLSVKDTLFPITDPEVMLHRYAFFHGISIRDDAHALGQKLQERPTPDILAAARVLQHGHLSVLNNRALQKMEEFIWRLEDVVVGKLVEAATNQKGVFHDRATRVIEDFYRWDALIAPGGEVNEHTVKAIIEYREPAEEAEQQRAKGNIALVTGAVHAVFAILVEGLRKMSKAKSAARAGAGVKTGMAGVAEKPAKAAAGAAEHHSPARH